MFWPKKRKFQKEVLQEIVARSLPLPEKERFAFILQQLHQTYDTPQTPNIYLFNGGTAHGLICLLYASCTEYLILYGTPLNNGGHSGRYLMNVYDFVFRGKVTIAAASLDAIEGREVHPGQTTFLPWGAAHNYMLDKNTWMIEYAYGFIPSALPFMLLGCLATGDVVATGQLTCAYAQEVIKNVWRAIKPSKQATLTKEIG